MSATVTKTSKNQPLLIHNGYSYTIDRKTEAKILWKCSYAKKYACHGQLHTKLNYEFIKTVGQHENHIGNSRGEATRKYYEQLRQEFEQNQTNPHNVLTQTNIGVPDEVLICLPSNHNLKRNFVCCFLFHNIINIVYFFFASHILFNLYFASKCPSEQLS